MADSVDDANDIAQFITGAALKKHAANQDQSSQTIIDSIVYCADCDAEIEPDRLAILPHCVRCISCQQLHEKEERLYGNNY